MKGHQHQSSSPLLSSSPSKRRCTGLAAAVPALVVCSTLLPLVYLLVLHRPAGACVRPSEPRICRLPSLFSVLSDPLTARVASRAPCCCFACSRLWIGRPRRRGHQHRKLLHFPSQCRNFFRPITSSSQRISRVPASEILTPWLCLGLLGAGRPRGAWQAASREWGRHEAQAAQGYNNPCLLHYTAQEAVFSILFVCVCVFF